MKQQLTRLFAAAALMAVTATALVGPPLAARAHDNDDRDGQHQPARDVVDILQLLADFHGALGYGGNITAMMDLWADNSSVTLNGVAHVGKDQVRTFFVTGGYFLNNWVSLAPEYKTQITVDGDKAQASTQCVAIDLSVTPMVVRSVIQVNAEMRRIHGKWLFVSMNNTTPAPL